MIPIYYIFKDHIPSQNQILKKGYDSLAEFIFESTTIDILVEDITRSYDGSINNYIEELLDENETVISKIKHDLNIDTHIGPSLFTEDTSYKHDDYIKLTTNETILKDYLSFIVNLNEEFSKIQKEQIEDASKKLPYIDQVNNAQNKKYNTFTKTRDEYINPVYQKCAIALIDVETDYEGDYVGFYDLNEFINLMINDVNNNKSATYYVHSKLCAVSEM